MLPVCSITLLQTKFTDFYEQLMTVSSVNGYSMFSLAVSTGTKSIMHYGSKFHNVFFFSDLRPHPH
jgi:hypothetical protein